MKKNLSKNAYQFAVQAHRLLDTFNSTLHPETEACCRISHQSTRATCVVNLNNQWAQFNRKLFIYSSDGGWVTRASILLPRAVRLSVGENPISKLRALVGRRAPYWEPNWSVANEMIRMHGLIGTSNFLDISAALGSINSSSDEVRLLRNFIVHKNSSTAQKAQSILSIHGVSLPLDVGSLLTKPTPTSSTLFEYWVDNLTLIAISST